MSEETERLRSDLQDAYLVIGEQHVLIRRYLIVIEQLQNEITLKAEQNGSESSRLPSDVLDSVRGSDAPA